MQLDRWPCHSLSDYYIRLKNTTIEHSERLVTPWDMLSERWKDLTWPSKRQWQWLLEKQPFKTIAVCRQVSAGWVEYLSPMEGTSPLQQSLLLWPHRRALDRDAWASRGYHSMGLVCQGIGWPLAFWNYLLFLGVGFWWWVWGIFFGCQYHMLQKEGGDIFYHLDKPACLIIR